MKKFFVLYKAPVEEFQKMMQSSTPEQQKAGMDEWRTWMDEHKAALVDGGNPVGKTKQVSNTGVSDIRNDVGGYSIIQAESHEEAAKIMQSNPHLKMAPSATIEISEIIQM